MKSIYSFFIIFLFAISFSCVEVMAAEVLQISSPSTLLIGDHNRTYTVKISCLDIYPDKEKYTLNLKSVKRLLATILEMILWLLLMTLATVGFLLMMAFYVIADNIHDCYAYLFKKERLSKPSLCLTTFCRLVKIGIKKLPKMWSGLKSHLRFPS